MKIKKFVLLIIITIIFTGCSEPVSNIDGVDIDLTALSQIMVYSEVNNMYASPADYMDKVIKISGTYSSEYFDQTDLYYHYVVFEDASACCVSGIEFIWEGEHNYPADYPNDGDTIEICGMFKSYDELGLTYYYLSVDDIVIK